MEAYRRLLEDLTVSLLCHVSHLQMYNTFYLLMVFDVRIGINYYNVYLFLNKL